jgi:hypothetical protein
MNGDLLLTEEAPARRGFLRTLVAAPVAALATHRLILPARTIVEDPAERLQRHVSGVEAAMRDLFPGVHVRHWGNAFDPETHARYREILDAENRGAVAVVTVDARIYMQVPV